ncbi:MAG: hypothetical protein K8S54_14565 [Spirochaetia bacterium]|nr:hypothetical protein [Spirochaetia bacterium]
MPGFLHARITSDRITVSGEIAFGDEYDISSPLSRRNFAALEVSTLLKASDEALARAIVRSELNSFETFLDESIQQEVRAPLAMRRASGHNLAAGEFLELHATGGSVFALDPVNVRLKGILYSEQTCLKGVLREGVRVCLHYHSIRQGYAGKDSIALLTILPGVADAGPYLQFLLLSSFQPTQKTANPGNTPENRQILPLFQREGLRISGAIA